jgi:hypothetical protein
MLKSHYVLSRRTFLALDDREFDLRSLGERAEAFAADGAVVDEDVIAAVMSDKAKALSIVEPFYGSGRAFCHDEYPL